MNPGVEKAAVAELLDRLERLNRAKTPMEIATVGVPLLRDCAQPTQIFLCALTIVLGRNPVALSYDPQRGRVSSAATMGNRRALVEADGLQELIPQLLLACSAALDFQVSPGDKQEK